MRQHLFNFLKQHLLARGFTKSYVDQLINELWDHHQCLVDEYKLSGMKEQDAEQKALDQLGKEERILAEVLARKELMPFPKKRPILTFIFLPIILIILDIFIVLIGPISILDIFNADMTTAEIMASGYIELLEVLTFIIAYLTPPIAMVLFCYLADRYAVSLKWLAASMGIIALIGSMLVFTIHYPGSENLGAMLHSYPDIAEEGGLILNGGFWSEFGANYVSFTLPILIFVLFSWYRNYLHKKNTYITL